jgi:CheY-like chemotaxis protein
MRRTILLADDSVTIRKIVELTFGETDIRVESVGSGREALEKLRDLRPDLVLADVVMPGPSGYEVCRAVKASDRPVPVLLLAGTFEPFDALQARECGSDGHVTKPFDSRLLVERVEQLLARGRAEPSGVAAKHGIDDDLEAMFDDLAQPERPGMIDARPAPESPDRDEAPAPAESWDDGVAGEATIPVASEGDDAAERTAGPDDVVPSGGAFPPTLHPADIDAIARAVVVQLSERVLREIAWDVVPDLAEMIVRERIRELERGERESS